MMPRFKHWILATYRLVKTKIINYWYAKPALPVVSLPYNVALKKQQERWLITFILLIAITAYYAYVYLQQQRVNQELLTVLVFSEDLDRPVVLTPEHLTTQTFSRFKLPSGTFATETKASLVGQTLVRDVLANEIVLPHHVQSKLDPESVSAQFENAFGFTMDESWFQAKLPNLKAGDVIDILVSNPEGDLDATITVAQGLEVVTVQRSNQKKTLIVNVTDAQAKQVLFARGLRLPMQVLLHSALNTPSTTLES
jgi:Flp pilus assembly protein CpaB